MLTKTDQNKYDQNAVPKNLSFQKTSQVDHFSMHIGDKPQLLKERRRDYDHVQLHDALQARYHQGHKG